MRDFAVTLCLCAIAASAALAQENSAPSEPPALEPRQVYSPPPASLQILTGWDIASIRAARGNVARWRDSERQRLGPYEATRRSGRQNALQEVSGYFAFLGDPRLPAGVVEAHWERPSAGVGQMGWVVATYSAGRTICGGALGSIASDIAELTYLGSNWRSEFDVLDTQLAALAPLPDGRTLPEGVSAPTAQYPHAGDFARFYPMRAQHAAVQGYVDLNCLVREDLSLQCGILSEKPEGWQFGQAAQRIMRQTRVAPLASDGQPTPGVCTPRRVNFAVPE